MDQRLPFEESSRLWSELSEPERDFFCFDDDVASLPPNHAAQMALLAPGDNDRLASWAFAALPPGWPDGGDKFEWEDQLRIHECWNDPVRVAQVRRWLFDRGIPFRRTVYLIYGYDRVVQTTWRMVVRYWDAFAWSVGYAMVAVDHTLQWACCFHHEEVIVFGSRSNTCRTSRCT